MERIRAGRLLRVDLVDQHDGVLDLHAHQAQHPQQRHEPEGLANRWRLVKSYWKLYPFAH